MHVCRASFLFHQPVLYPDTAVANPLNLCGRMGNRHDRRPRPFDFHQASKALRLKIHVTDSQYFVNQQNIRIYINRHGKRQTHIHSRRIGAHGIVDKFLQLGKFNDPANSLVNFLSSKPKNRSVNINIFPAAHIRVKSCAKLQQARYPPV